MEMGWNATRAVANGIYRTSLSIWLIWWFALSWNDMVEWRSKVSLLRVEEDELFEG